MAPTYRVKTPELVKRLDLEAMDLVRKCGIAIGTAYKAMSPATSSGVNLDSCWKIYQGLRVNGYTIDGRPIQWNDVVDFVFDE